MHVKQAWRAALKGAGGRNACSSTEGSLCLGTGGKVMFTPSIVSARSEFTCETAFVWQMFATLV